MKDFHNVRVGLGKRFLTLLEVRTFLFGNVPELNGKKPDFNVVDIGCIELSTG